MEGAKAGQYIKLQRPSGFYTILRNITVKLGFDMIKRKQRNSAMIIYEFCLKHTLQTKDCIALKLTNIYFSIYLITLFLKAVRLVA